MFQEFRCKSCGGENVFMPLDSAEFVKGVSGGRDDTAPNLEARFLEALSASRRRLPDRTQICPEPDVYAEADFYYDWDGLKGIAVFVDGPHHDEPTQREADQRERKKLEDLGYRVIVIRHDAPLEDQIRRNADVFGRALADSARGGKGCITLILEASRAQRNQGSLGHLA